MKGKLLAFTMLSGHYFIDLKNITTPQPESGKRFVSFSMQPIEVSKTVFLETIKKSGLKNRFGKPKVSRT